MEQKYRFSLNGSGAELSSIIAAVTRQNAHETDGTLKGLIGAESFSGSMAERVEKMDFNQRNAVESAIKGSENFKSRAQALNALIQHGGNESFSMQLDAGNVARQKAATIDLNARSNRQWEGAEALYSTVIVPYDNEALSLPIDVAGVGAYNSSGNVNESWEDLVPIAAVLSDSKFNAGDDLRLVPVLPANPADENTAAFVSSTDWTPWDVTYDAGDLLGRQAHKTNFLAIRKLGNLLNLCRAPGAAPFENNDEIEASGIRIEKLLFKIKTKDGEGVVTLDTSSMSGIAARPSTGTTSEDKRQVNFVENGINITNFKDADGKSTELFKSLTDAGLEVFLQFDLSATYQRSTRAWSPTTIAPTVAYVRNADGHKLTPGTPSMPAATGALVTAQAVEVTILGVNLKLNHANTNRSRYGTTVVYANTMKSYNINRRQPISVKYPWSDQDNNADVLSKLVTQMDVMVTRNMSHDAFKAAHEHFNYIVDNTGAKIVNINDDSSSVLPGQHFLRTVGVKAEMSLIEEVSTLDSKDTLVNIQAALVNRLWDIITALRINSNMAALKELDNRKEEYTIVAHASLAPFIMKAGDYRTFGTNIKFNVVETNIDSEVGSLWVVPTSQTSNGNIDIFGGIGICVTKELLVIEGHVAQADRQYRMIITQPAYQHHSLCPVIGRLTITDIEDLLGNEGLITRVNKHLIGGKITTVVEGDADGAKEVAIDTP